MKKRLSNTTIDIGELQPSSNVAVLIDTASVQDALNRHRACDWGDVEKSEWTRNNRSALVGRLVFSTFHYDRGRKLWIVTTGDRSRTAIFLTEER